MECGGLDTNRVVVLRDLRRIYRAVYDDYYHVHDLLSTLYAPVRKIHKPKPRFARKPISPYRTTCCVMNLSSHTISHLAHSKNSEN